MENFDSLRDLKNNYYYKYYIKIYPLNCDIKIENINQSTKINSGVKILKINEYYQDIVDPGYF